MPDLPHRAAGPPAGELVQLATFHDGALRVVAHAPADRVAGQHHDVSTPAEIAIDRVELLGRPVLAVAVDHHHRVGVQQFRILVDVQVAHHVVLVTALLQPDQGEPFRAIRWL